MKSISGQASARAHKVIVFNAGHVYQNLYLACEALDAGICAIGAYYQEDMDDLLGFDGKKFTSISHP